MTKKQYYLLIVLLLGLITHFAFFGQPNETVFDEVHFGGFISSYYAGQYFFDIHPPLGKLAIAGFAKFFDFKPEFSFAEIGNKYPDNKYLALRFLPTLAGAVLPLVIFLILIELGLKHESALFGGILIALENALLTQSRFILLDSFLLLFGFLALLFYLIYTRTNKLRYLVLAGTLGSLTMSVKWTGGSFLALITVFETVRLLRNHQPVKLIKNYGYLIILPVFIYFLSFAIHFSLLHKSGPGDAFMTPEFRMTLENSPDYNPDGQDRLNLVQKFIELNVEMYESNQRLTATHPYASPWYSWPFLKRTIYYWVNGDARIYLIGNPFIWIASTAAVLYLVFSIIYSIFEKPGHRYKMHYSLYILLGGYILNMLPFIGVHRVMFLYHYFTALIFAIMILAYLIDRYVENKKWLYAFVLISLLVFVYFAPLNYGLELSRDSFENRMWLSTWE